MTFDREIPWNVRVDASVDPVCVVFAPGWFEARGVASAVLDVWPTRIYVEQLRRREFCEYAARKGQIWHRNAARARAHRCS